MFGAPPCAPSCRPSLVKCLCAWATYRPLHRTRCDKCRACCGYHCFPPLYAYFCEPCVEGCGQGGCGSSCGSCGGSCARDKGCGNLLTCGHRLFPMGTGHACCAGPLVCPP
jgi:hypothetical protein